MNPNMFKSLCKLVEIETTLFETIYRIKQMQMALKPPLKRRGQFSCFSKEMYPKTRIVLLCSYIKWRHIKSFNKIKQLIPSQVNLPSNHHLLTPTGYPPTNPSIPHNSPGVFCQLFDLLGERLGETSPTGWHLRCWCLKLWTFNNSNRL